MLRPLLYCLLVLLTPVDDAFARATPEPEDDAMAAANNDFLAPAVQASVVAPPAAVPGAPLATASTRAGALTGALPCGPGPLFLLMSFQC
jgi:hypothetical protein